jgi:hypothetical protein
MERQGRSMKLGTWFSNRLGLHPGHSAGGSKHLLHFGGTGLDFVRLGDFQCIQPPSFKKTGP